MSEYHKTCPGLPLRWGHGSSYHFFSMLRAVLIIRQFAAAIFQKIAF